MPDLLTTFATFSSIDYKGINALSSYALSSTPLTFIPKLPPGSNNEVLWSFGDGTTSNNLSAIKYYTFPGEYTVTLVVNDCITRSQVSSFTKAIKIIDYIPYSLEITNLSSTLSSHIQTQSQIDGPWILKATYPPYQPTNNILWQYDGSDSTNFFNISSDKYVHLRKTFSLYRKLSNISLSANYFVEEPYISPSTVPVYAKITDGEIIQTYIEDDNTFYVGASSVTPIYFKDDTSGDRILGFKFDSRNTYVPTLQNYLNNTNVSLRLTVTATASPVSASITSNGIDGEKYAITSFNISPIKFFNTKIPFTFKLKDSDGFSYKDASEYDSVDVLCNLLSSNNDPLSSVFNYTITHVASASYPGSYTATLSVSSLEYPINVKLRCDDVVNGLSSLSNEFIIYPTNYYDLYKKNEDFNAKQTLFDLTLQETIQNNPTLFEFFETVLGGITPNHENISTKIYEKIANFIQNTSDVDTCEIRPLISALKIFQNSKFDFDRGLLNYPEKVKRILNLISINYNRLFGTSNKFQENFNPRGHTIKDVYGSNLGEPLDTLTYIVSAGTDIVAYEKFSGTYTRINSNQPFTDGTILSSASTAPLSSYNTEWGWPLVLPSTFSPYEIDKYYTFYDFISSYDNRVIDGIIDFENVGTTILSTTTKTSLESAGGFYDYMILDVLYQSLSV